MARVTAESAKVSGSCVSSLAFPHCHATRAAEPCSLLKPLLILTRPPPSPTLIFPTLQAAEAGFEAAYAFIAQAQEAMSEEEKAKPIKQMKPTVRAWPLFYQVAAGTLLHLYRLSSTPTALYANHHCAWSDETDPLCNICLQAEQDPNDPEGQTSVKQSLLINVSLRGPEQRCRGQPAV